MDPERESFEALLRASTDLVLAEGAPVAVAKDAVAWLSARGLGADDAKELAAVGASRLLVYRRHIRTSLARAVRQEIPRAAARAGDAFTAWVERWIDEAGPRSPYLRDLAFELVAWVAPRWATDPSVPSYLADLARHELLHFEVAAAPDAESSGPAGGSESIALDRRVSFASSVRINRYAHAVHLLDEDLDARDVPEATPTALLAYRDAEMEVRFLALTPLAADILERLLHGREALGAAVTAACAARGAALDGAVTSSTAALLQDLVDRGAVTGGEAC